MWEILSYEAQQKRETIPRKRNTPCPCSEVITDSDDAITLREEDCTHQLMEEGSDSWVKPYVLKDLCLQKILSWKTKLFPLHFCACSFWFLSLRPVAWTWSCSLDCFELPIHGPIFSVPIFSGKHHMNTAIPKNSVTSSSKTCPPLPNTFPNKLLSSVF